MSVGISLEELMDYSDHERAKWKEWIAAEPKRLDIPFQGGGDFPTVGSLLDHVFLVERRHLARLEGATPPDMTGVRAGDWKALFEYADFVRADFRKYVSDLDEATAGELMTVIVESGRQTMTRRWLAAHILLHEIRHLAQIAFAARIAGHEPPGQHDVFYFRETV
jgi:uncharacterized damage-inducible protein DinB